MRIVYGVHGYGRGHATRALAVLPELTRRHDLLILAGGDAYDALANEYPVVRIPTFGYHYGPAGERSVLRTIARNLSGALDLMLSGPALDMVVSAIEQFAPHVAISDAEAWTHRAAQQLGVPRIGFDHFGVLVYCRPPMSTADRLEAAGDAFVYRRLMGRPQRVIVSSFYDAPARSADIRIVGPLLRNEVLQTAARAGETLLVYLNKGRQQFTPALESVLRRAGSPAIVYGTPRRGSDGNLSFRPPANRAFLDDLAGCRAVLSTAGNQLVGEAIYLGKPMLVMPERCVEQRLNAAAVERLGIGRRTVARRLTADVLRDFLRDAPQYAGNLRRLTRDGRAEALDVIEQFLHELAPTAADRPHQPGATPAVNAASRNHPADVAA